MLAGRTPFEERRREDIWRKIISYFQREAETQVRSDCPYIFKCLSAFQTTDHLVMTMSYLMGGDFKTFLYRTDSGKSNEDEALFYLSELALGVQYLHTKLHIVHRDLKPDIVLMDAKGHVKICDLGLSQALRTRKKGEDR